ncbi:(-)-isopiperitenol/(-)-carveol dehydrogenase, mitochondrial-like [Nicotiana tomentosiformis]|uniref:(-)-isopiperitenol/(-)-carveol dehydrogenase, mitochondrial-like n=1 Tax=Nicotiana tomentosiformis TaxID=4098 RepID=UPI00051B92C3|nr:(-)-isopiperitenol/(-)-carveol dehydrogenase, mitochondrial-like [Nicotiana tomentosiformis]
MQKLEGKVATVTGGASGIGEAAARLFAHHGAHVVIADIQDEKGRALAESIPFQRCSYVHCDVSDETQVKAMVDWTVQKYGQLDIMFSNAGVVGNSGQKVIDLDLSEFDRVLRVNARGMAACVKHAARAMVEQRVRGSIICTASIAASRAGPWRTDYVMSKHAVLGLVKSASRQLGEYGIRVNSVSPSAVMTPIMLSAEQETSLKVLKMYGNLTSLKGITLTVKHLADAVLFLASDDSAFVSGHDLVLDGGLLSLPSPNSSL